MNPGGQGPVRRMPLVGLPTGPCLHGRAGPWNRSNFAAAELARPVPLLGDGGVGRRRGHRNRVRRLRRRHPRRTARGIPCRRRWSGARSLGHPVPARRARRAVVIGSLPPAIMSISPRMHGVMARGTRGGFTRPPGRPAPPRTTTRPGVVCPRARQVQPLHRPTRTLPGLRARIRNRLRYARTDARKVLIDP